MVVQLSVAWVGNGPFHAGEALCSWRKGSEGEILENVSVDGWGCVVVAACFQKPGFLDARNDWLLV